MPLNPVNEMLIEMAGNGQNSGSIPQINFNTADPSETLASLIERDQARVEQDYYPVEDQAIASLDDMSIIDDARERVSDRSSIERSLARADRESSRYGFRASAAARRNAQADAHLGRATSDADVMNEARMNQFDRNRGFRSQLINIGRGVSEQSVNGLTEAAGLQSARDARNRNASAAARASQMQTFGSLATLAIMAL